MGYSLTWMVPRRLLKIEMTGYFDKAQLEQFNEELQAAGEHGQAPIHLIFDIKPDFRSQISVPMLTKTMVLGDPCFGWIVAISNSTTLQFFGKTLSTLTRFDLKMVSNFDAALAFLREKDTSLPSTLLTS